VTDFGTSGAAISNVVGEVMAFGANGDNFFAAGTDFAPGLDAEWRIEKRNLNSGGLISTFGINGVITENLSAGDDTITDIVLNADNNSLYVVGYDFTAGVNPEIRIERRDMDTGGLVGEFGTGGIITESPSGYGIPFAVTLDSGGFYVAGFDTGGTGGADQWRIEKRELGSGALINGFGTGGVVTEYVSGGTGGNDIATDLRVNDSALYIIGATNAGLVTPRSWRIEKRNTTTGELFSDFGTGGAISETLGSGATPVSIVLDSTGLYVGGFVGQILLVGGFSINQKGGFEPRKEPILSVEDINDDPGDYYWRVEKRDLSSGALSANFGTDGVYIYNPNESKSDVDEIFDLAIDDNGLYIFGMSNTSFGQYLWMIQKLQFPDVVEVAAASTAAPEILPETGADRGGGSNYSLIVAAIVTPILLVGSALLIRSRSRV